MKRSGRGILILIFNLLILLAACTAPADESPANTTTLTVEDALGRTVTLEEPPQRIVIGGKANFMLEDAIYTFPAAPDRVTGLTQAQQRTKPFIALLDDNVDDKLRFTVNSTAEEIAAAGPDLVILKRMMKESVGDALETLEIPVIYLDFETPEQYERDLATLGTVFANAERADAVWSFYQGRLDEINEALSDLNENLAPEVLVVQYNLQGAETALEVPPPSWIQTQMVEILGADPVWVDASQGGWTVVNFEQIAAWDPEHIFVISYFEDTDEVVDRLANNPDWQQLQAVQDNNLHGFPKDFYSWDQPDTRWILGLTWMATRLYPARFEAVDMEAHFYDFYTELYGLEPETIEADIVPLLQGDIAVE